MSEFLIKTPSQGYLATLLETQNGPLGPLVGNIDKPFELEVNLGEKSSVHVKVRGKHVIPDIIGGAFVKKDSIVDYTLNLDNNDLSQVKSVQINNFEEKILGTVQP